MIEPVSLRELGATLRQAWEKFPKVCYCADCRDFEYQFAALLDRLDAPQPPAQDYASENAIGAALRQLEKFEICESAAAQMICAKNAKHILCAAWLEHLKRVRLDTQPEEMPTDPTDDDDNQCAICGWRHDAAPPAQPTPDKPVKQYRPLADCRRALAESVEQSTRLWWRGHSGYPLFEERVQEIEAALNAYGERVDAQPEDGRPVAHLREATKDAPNLLLDHTVEEARKIAGR